MHTVTRKLCLLLVSAAIVVLPMGICGAAGEYAAWRPSFLVSPDGSYLILGIQGFTDKAEILTRITGYDLATGKKRELASLPGVCDEIFRLDDGAIAVSSQPSLTYYILSPDGKILREVSLPDNCFVTHKRISPDGKLVAFTGHTGATEIDFKPGLFVFDSEAGALRCLIKGKPESVPAWSPDSKEIAVCNAGRKDPEYPLVIVDARSGRVRDTGFYGTGAQWSPDGRYIAFITDAKLGGCWFESVPYDGRIAVLEVSSGRVTTVSPEGKYTRGADDKTRSFFGSMLPVWAYDSKRLAYKSVTRTYGPSGTKDVESTWIAGIDDSDPVKAADGSFMPAWTADGGALFLSSEYSIKSFETASGKTRDIISWKPAEPPEPSSSDIVTVRRPDVTVKATFIERPYAEAMANIVSAAKAEYEHEFGFSIPEQVTFNAEKDPFGRTALWTDGVSSMMLVVESDAELSDPVREGIYHIHGFVHELGHMIMYRRMIDVVGLPDGIGEGWAHYISSIVVDAVAKKLGKDIWPTPYDAPAREGFARLEREVEGRDWEKLDATERGAKLFYEAEKKYGRKAVTDAMGQALSGKPSGTELMPLFIKSLEKTSGDKNAGSRIPQDLLEAKLVWEIKEKYPGVDFFNELNTERRKDGGALLSYGDGTPDGMESITGAGQAVLFRTPPGEWLIDSVDIYGMRYGSVKAPAKEFTIYICDKEFELVAAPEFPYSVFGRRSPAWAGVPMGGIPAPEIFYVCVYFESSYREGIYLYYDKGGYSRPHSRYALPFTFVSDTQGKYDWMIRVYLRPALK